MALPAYVTYIIIGLFVVGGVAVLAGDQVMNAVTGATQTTDTTDSTHADSTQTSTGLTFPSVQAKITKTDLNLVRTDEFGMTYYDATVDIDGNPQYVEYVQLDLPPYVYRPQGGVGIYAGYNRVAALDEKGTRHNAFSMSEGAYHRGFFISTSQDGTRDVSDYLEIKPESTNPLATLYLFNYVPENIILKEGKDYNFTVMTSEGVSMIAAYIHIKDDSVKYYGSNYHGFIPESTNIQDESTPFGTNFVIPRSKFERNFPIGLEEFEMQFVILDKAGNVLESKWIGVELQ